jgi:hypothetical protein
MPLGHYEIFPARGKISAGTTHHINASRGESFAYKSSGGASRPSDRSGQGRGFTPEASDLPTIQDSMSRSYCIGAGLPPTPPYEDYRCRPGVRRQ